jgi:hypothetical protein
MVMVPNPRALGNGPEHWDRGIHYVRPFNLGRTIALITVSPVTVGAAIPPGRNKTAKNWKQFRFHNFSNFPFVARPQVGRVSDRLFKLEQLPQTPVQPI